MFPFLLLYDNSNRGSYQKHSLILLANKVKDYWNISQLMVGIVK